MIKFGERSESFSGYKIVLNVQRAYFKCTFNVFAFHSESNQRILVKICNEG